MTSTSYLTFLAHAQELKASWRDDAAGHRLLHISKESIALLHEELMN